MEIATSGDRRRDSSPPNGRAVVVRRACARKSSLRGGDKRIARLIDGAGRWNRGRSLTPSLSVCSAEVRRHVPEGDLFGR